MAAWAFLLVAPPSVSQFERSAALDELERARAELGLSAGDVTVFLYPDLASFVKGSRGKPSLAGRWHRGALHLAPVATLRERGLLRSTVRHELAHRWVAERSRGRAPRWFEEGVCVWKAGETASSRHEEKILAVSRGRRVSYGEAGRYVESLAARRGAETIEAMLGAFGRGAKAGAVFAEFAGESPETIRF